MSKFYIKNSSQQYMYHNYTQIKQNVFIWKKTRKMKHN